MDSLILDHIPFQIDLALLAKNMRVKEGSGQAERLQQLADEAQAVAKPKALYKVAFIDSKGEDRVIVNGIALTSRVLCVNLEKAHRIFPFVATCGEELEKWSKIGRAHV